MNTHFIPSRRDLLKGGGALIVSFSLAGTSTPRSRKARRPRKPLALTEVDCVSRDRRQGQRHHLFRQGRSRHRHRHGAAQIVAEELDVPIEPRRSRHGRHHAHARPGPDLGQPHDPARRHADPQRGRDRAQALLEEAAKRLGAKPEDLTVADGVITRRRQAGELRRADRRQDVLRSSSTTPSPPRPRTRRTTRSSASRCRASTSPTRSPGRFTYMQDFRVPGMLHGRVVRPPAIGAKLESVDESSDQGHPGHRQGGARGQFPRRRRRDEWAAIKAARDAQGHLVEMGRRCPTRPSSGSTCAPPRSVKDEVTSNVGDTAAAMAQGRRQEAPGDLRLRHPTHGSIGPSCAVAEFKDGKLTSWSASQATHDLRKQLAQMFALPPENVRCIYLEGAGCYGRNGHEDAAADAALLAKAVGKPVRVQWSRADEHGWDPKGPPTLIDMRASAGRRRQRHGLGSRNSSFRSRRRAASWCR